MPKKWTFCEKYFVIVGMFHKIKFLNVFDKDILGRFYSSLLPIAYSLLTVRS